MLPEASTPGKPLGCLWRRSLWRDSVAYCSRYPDRAARRRDRGLRPGRRAGHRRSARQDGGLRALPFRPVRGLPGETAAPAAHLGARGHRPRGGVGCGRRGLRRRRSRRHHVPGVDLRRLRTMPVRPRALLPAAAQFRLYRKWRASRLCCSACAVPGPRAGCAPGRRSRPTVLRRLDRLRRAPRSRIAAGTTKRKMPRPLGPDLALPAESAGRTLQKQWGGADAAIVLTGSPAAIQQAFRSLKRTGTLITSGLSTNQYELPIVDTVLKGISIRGSYLGTRADLDEVFRLAQSGVGRAHIERHSLDQAPAVFERMRQGEILGRAVVVF